MDRKARIIRFYLLLAAMLACVVVWPEIGVGLWPVAFFFPNCLCCGTPTCADACSSTPAQMQITISGVANGTCVDCATVYNGTAFLNFDNGLSTFFGACAFSEVGVFSGCSRSFAGNVRIHDNGGSVRMVSGISLTPGVGSATDQALYENTDIGEGAPPIDCTTISGKVLAYVSSVDSSCDWTGSSVTSGAV